MNQVKHFVINWLWGATPIVVLILLFSGLAWIIENVAIENIMVVVAIAIIIVGPYAVGRLLRDTDRLDKEEDRYKEFVKQREADRIKGIE
jgi:hypothetical protein